MQTKACNYSLSKEIQIPLSDTQLIAPKMPDFIGASTEVFAQRMLESGLFPENLPPTFKIKNFYEAVKIEIETSTYLTTKVTTESAKFSASKRNGQRRIFSVPNPVFMIDSPIFVIKYSDSIEEHFVLSSDSCSSPKFTTSGQRAQQVDTFNDFYLKRRSKFAESRYIVKTDISRFFHSIYTHCIPWSLHGKQLSKADRKFDSIDIFGNRLDYIVRQHQDGQTVGIPVGPDFSRIISEIIGVKIDRLFREKSGTAVPFLRLVDDIYIGSDNIDEANKMLGYMRDSIRELELDINESKTLIIEASKDNEAYWPIEIGILIDKYDMNFLNGVPASEEAPSFIQTLDKIIQMSVDQNDDGIIKFALRKIDNDLVWVKYWDSFEPFLVRCCISFPHSWDYVAQIVAMQNSFSSVNVPLWTRVIQKSLIQNVAYGHDFEVVWAIWLAINLEIKIEENIFVDIFKKCGPLSMLSALHLHKVSKMDCKIPKEMIIDRIGIKPMIGPNWILAYEADRQFDLKIKTKNLQGYDIFKKLYDYDVSFYDTGEVIESTQDKPSKPAIKKSSSYDEVEHPIAIGTMEYF